MTSRAWPGSGRAGARERHASTALRVRGRVPARWLTMALAALLALAVQSFVVQTHLHLGDRIASSPVAEQVASAIQPAHHAAHRSGPLDCPACRQLARAGAFVLPAPIVPVPPAPVLAWFAPLLLAPRFARRRSHAWHSRGPPAGARA